jgi:hypothetical protein
MISGQPRQKVHEIPSQPMVGCIGASLSSQLLEGSTNRKIVVQVSLVINQDPISKITNAKWVGGLAQVVEHLPSKFKALS